jgi:phosphoribosyl 1,2-cyclic phosphodiesterase
VPYHLRYADIVDHSGELGARRIMLTHMSADMLEHLDQARYEAAYDGLAVDVG